MPYLLDYFFEVGPTSSGGLGPAELTATEIRNWRLEMGLKLRPWEARTLKRLSRVYLDQASISGSPDCPAPFGARLSREEVEAKIDRVLGL
jgi:hypothetical protein